MAYVFICLVAFVFAALTMFTGFGLGMFLMPAFAIFFPREVALTAAAVVYLANNFFKLWLWGWHAKSLLVFRFAVPAALTAFAGVWLLKELSGLKPIAEFTVAGYRGVVTPLKLLLAIVIGGFAALELSPKSDRYVFPTKYLPVGGVLCGLFGGLSGYHATLRTTFLMRTDLSKEAFIATGIASAVVIDISRLLVYGSDFFSSDWVVMREKGALGVVVAASVSAFAGSILGTQLIDNISFRAVKIAIAVLLLMMAAGLAVGLV